MDTKTTLLTRQSALELLDLHPSVLDPTKSRPLSCADLPSPAMVLLPRGRHAMRGSFVSHWTKREIEGSDRILAGDGLMALKPEAAILQMCRGLSLPQVVALIDQYCGTYRIPRKEAIPAYAAAFPGKRAHYLPSGSGPTTCSGAAFYGIKPLVSTESIKRFLSSHPGFPGSKIVRRALPFCVDGLRSYLETEFNVLACLPRRLGGCNLPQPQVNMRIDLPTDLQKVSGKPYMLADCAWPDKKVAVELLGVADHAGDGITDTSVREKVYAALGWRCITITKAEINSPKLFRHALRQISKLLKFRLRSDLINYALRQRWLREEILLLSNQRAPNRKSYRKLPGVTLATPAKRRPKRQGATSAATNKTAPTESTAISTTIKTDTKTRQEQKMQTRRTHPPG